MRNQIEKIDLDVVEAGNVEEVFRTLEKDSPDLIALDAACPGVDGFEILKRLKADENTAIIPLIIVTSDDRIETREKAMRLGAGDFVSKPVKPEELTP